MDATRVSSGHVGGNRVAANPQLEAYPYHGFRGEREYMPVFRALGQNLGVLPRPLPRVLVFWYTTLTICLERA
jgi:hypothetical protein